MTSGAQPLTIGRGIRAVADRFPDKSAIHCGDDTLSYAELMDRAARAAAMLAEDYGVGPGDRVALIAPNCLEYLEIIIAVSDLGAMTAALSPKLSSTELNGILKDCAPRLVIHANDIARADIGLGCASLGFDAYIAAIEATAPSPVKDIAVETEPFVLHYTSGTTGAPKGVMVPHRSRVLSFLGMASEYGCYGPDDHFLAIAPLCHGAGLAFALASLYTGGTVTLEADFNPSRLVHMLGDRAITGLFCVPTHFQRIFELPKADLATVKQHKLKALISNAAPLLQADKEKVIDLFGEGILFECYGATESGIVTNLRPHQHLEKADCVGSPFVATQVKLLNEDGSPTPVGEVGELFSRSPYLFSGYWQRDEDTKEAWREDWVSVGDLARCDEDGCYYILGRKNDMILSGGINIYPKMIEDILLTLDGVEEVAVVGLPDPKWGQIVHAEIVMRGDASLTSQEVIAFCRNDLSAYAVPKSVSFANHLPRNSGGKVLKRAIREEALSKRR
ncbi:MAG: class I adenylate-forming enzyme family protein [Pseudomonadota bacterium]